MERRRLLVHAPALLPLSLAGCLDSIRPLGDDQSAGRDATTHSETTSDAATADATTERTATSKPTVSLAELPPFPEGPKEPPTPPNVWDESSATSFAKEYEERRLYNEYYAEDVTDITIACTTPDVKKTEAGYEVSMWCQGAVYEENSKTHADYIGPEIIYRLTSTAVTRERGDS